jgi:hypothetical protein
MAIHVPAVNVSCLDVAYQSYVLTLALVIQEFKASS